MKAEYSTDELLPLSGIQHFCFCRRQWALIHIENQWQDNVLTAEGKLMHDRADDPFFSEVRREVVIARSVPVSSYRLGLNGVCDVVDFHLSYEGIHIPGRKEQYLPIPIEYKHGDVKRDHSDEAQLCAQAICLEEMLSTDIPFGYLYYRKTRHREKVPLTEGLRNFVFKMAGEMHAYYDRSYTPQVRPTKACQNCSLKEICLPGMLGNVITASKYIQMQINGE